MAPWLAEHATTPFVIDPNYRLTLKDCRYRLGMALEKELSVDISKKHFKLVR